MIFQKCKKYLEDNLFPNLTKEETISAVVNGFTFKEWLEELKNYTVLVEEIELKKENRSFWGYIGEILKSCILYELEHKEVPTIRGER